MKPLIAIIGPRNAGKSTVIQALTGSPTKTFNGFIHDRQSKAKIRIIAASPQELPISSARLDGIIRRAARDKHCTGVVIALQPTTPWRRQSMEQVLDIGRRYGFNLSAFLIHPARHKSLSAAKLKSLRIRLAARNLNIQVLNGRRFAHVNASIVRDTSGIF